MVLVNVRTQKHKPKASAAARKRSGISRDAMVEVARTMVVPGVTRESGYFGRYNQPGNLDEELKFHDVQLNYGAGDRTAGLVLPPGTINAIPQGILQNTRIGRKCTIKSINWRGDVTFLAQSGTAIDGPQSVRLMLIQDKQCNGATATTLNILSTANYQSFNNLANRGRFLTLMDKTFVLNAHAAAGNGTADDTGAWREQFTLFKKCDIPLEFDNITGAITEIRSNNLLMFAISAGTASDWVCTSICRLRFIG